MKCALIYILYFPTELKLEGGEVVMNLVSECFKDCVRSLTLHTNKPHERSCSEDPIEFAFPLSIELEQIGIII